MKKKAAPRSAKASSRQSALNFPTSSESDLVAEAAAAETSTQSGAKKRRKLTADFADDADKSTKSHCDSSATSAQSAVKTQTLASTTSLSSAPTERNTIAQGKQRSAATLGKQSPNTESRVGAVESRLPIAWRWSNLREVLTSIDTGKSFRCEERPPQPQEIGVVKVSAVTWGTYNECESKTCVDGSRINEQYFVQPGDFLFSRANTIQLIGACVIADNVTRRMMLSDKILRFRFSSDVLPKWLLYWLRSTRGHREIERLSTGNQESMRNIGQDRIRQIQIPLAPLPEQRCIVAEIEKQFTRLDAGVAALKRVQANLKRYRAAVLKAACEGRLVPTEAELRKDEGRMMNEETKRAKPGASTSSFIPHTSSFESGEALLARILTERRQNCQGRGKYKEPLLPDSDYLGPVPDGWAVGSISQIAECLDGRRVPINKGERLKRLGDIPYYGANGRVGWIDNHLFDETLVLVVEDETFVGRTLPFSYLIHGKSWVNNHAHILRATSAVQPAYLNYALAYYPFTARTTGSTGRRKLTQQALMTAPFALPPLAEQTRIVAEVERRLSVVEELEAVVSANLQRATRLRQSILQKAFTGELV